MHLSDTSQRSTKIIVVHLFMWQIDGLADSWWACSYAAYCLWFVDVWKIYLDQTWILVWPLSNSSISWVPITASQQNNLSPNRVIHTNECTLYASMVPFTSKSCDLIWHNYYSFNHVNFWSCISIARPHPSVQSGGVFNLLGKLLSLYDTHWPVSFSSPFTLEFFITML